MTDILPRHQISRVRRDTRRRSLTVTAVERITPQMLRVSLASPDLHDFESLGADDHIKLFFPAADGSSAMRDYTPRAFEPKAGTLVIDFALHGAGRDEDDHAGPATRWARSAKPGDRLEIGGPRGSNIVADDFDWYLLIGDETALPAIGRRIEELRAHVPVTTIVVVDSKLEQQSLQTKASWKGVWVSRRGETLDDAALLRYCLAEHPLPAGDGYIWIAAEAKTARALRSYILEVRNHPKAWLKASGYWVAGEIGAHQPIED